MEIFNRLAPEEKISLVLRDIYESYGYVKYRMSKFENYDLYADNRSFIPGGGIITFSDNRGNLLAMKPDVTLSIANSLPSELSSSEKIYYCENVYRMPVGASDYKEIMQLGVECIGNIDLFSVVEVLTLAKKSLTEISGNNILDISHIGLVSGIIDETGLNAFGKEELFKLISRKNVNEIEKLCEKYGVPRIIENCLVKLTDLYAPLETGIKQAEALDVNEKTHNAISELNEISGILMRMGYSNGMYLDFSAANNVSYYDGIIFKGYIDGVYSPILAGGSYGKLLKKLGKKSNAIGFAVYLDVLSEAPFEERSDDFTKLCYSEGSDVEKVFEDAERMRREGERVRVVREENNA